MTFDRRQFLKTTGATLGGLAVTSAGATAESEWNYELVGEALDAGTHEAVVQGDWAYSANGAEIATVDVSDPSTPLLGGTAVGHGQDNLDVKVEGDLAALANDGDAGSDTNPAGVTFFDVSDRRHPSSSPSTRARAGSTTASSTATTRTCVSTTSSSTRGWSSSTSATRRTP